VTSDVPVLLLSGTYDPVTPPRFAAEVAPHLSRGLHVVVPFGHHGTWGLSHDECVHDLIATFIDRGTTAGLDTACVSTMQPPPFVIDDATFAAQLQQVGG
jgi:hypothetical protein